MPLDLGRGGSLRSRMLRLFRRLRSVTGFRAGFGLSRFRRALAALAALAALETTACSGWRLPPPHEVPGLADPSQSYAVVLDTLRNEEYAIVDQDAAARTVRVRSHVDEHDPKRVSVILLSVDGNAVHLSASGFLVHPDGTTHHALISELAALDEALKKKLAGAAQVPASAVPDQPAPSVAGSLPVAWSEPARDPSVWGRGNFTCLPIKLADEEQTQLSLKLSNGETADVSLSLARAPELCRSPSECKLPGGCPALGIADAERVSRLAGRLSKHEIGPLATLLLRGQAVATIDLGKHGSIAQAMTEKR